MAYSPDDPNLLIPPSLRRPGLVPMPQAPTLLQPTSLRRAPVPPQQPPELDQAAIQAAQQQAQRQTYGEDHPFLSGVESGWEGLKGSGHGIAALAKGLVGDTEGERASLRAMQQNQANAADLDAGSPASLHDIHGVGDAFTWAEHQLGAALPGIAATIAPALVTGGAGALVSGGLRSAALRAAANEAGEAAISREAASLGADAAAGQAARNVAARAGTTIAEGSTPEQAASIARSAVAEQRLPRLRQIADSVSPASRLPQALGEQAGAVAGGTFVSGGSAASNLSPDMTDQQLKDASGKAALGALGEGALMAVPGLALMNRYGVGEAAKAALAKKMAAPLWKRLLREGGEQAAIGGAIAPATAAANRVVHNWITGQGLSDGLVSPDALSEYLNSAAGGAVAGFALGTPAGLRAGDVKLPALGTRNRAFRLFQRLGKSQDAAAKADAKPAPGTEINLDGTPKASDTEALFHSKLDKLQRVRSEWEQRTFGDVKPLDLNEDHAGAVTIGTTNNVPGAKLFDPAAMKIAQQTYPDDGMKAAMLSLLPDTNDVPRAQRSAAIDATAKAVQHGFDSLSKKDQTNVGRFLNLLPPDKVDGFKQVLGTVGALNDDQRSRLTLAPAKDAERKVAPDAASIGANDEGRAALGTEGGEGTGGLEGRLTERDALPTEELGNVPDAVWKAAQFSGDLSKSTLPRDEQVAIEVPKKGGGTRTAALSLRAAASGLSKTEGGKALLEGETNRKVGAVLGVIGEAATRGEKINPRSIHEGMRVFPDDGDGSGVLTAADAAEIRRRAANNGTPRSQAAAAAQRADMASAAVEKPQSVLGLPARAKADEQRATRGESKQSIIEPETPERAAGEGDFNAPGADERVFAPREYPGVGTGETMAAKGDAGAARSESLVKRITAGDARHESAIATLKKQYDAAKQMADAAKARGDQAAHGRAVARMKDAAARAKALRTAHAERRAKLVQQFKDVNADVRFKERGAGENPLQTKTSDAYKDDEARVEKFRKQLGLKLKGASLADLYKAAKAKPSTGKGLDPRTGLLGAIRRMADGDEKLTAQLDAIDGVNHPKERVLMTNSDKAAATKEPLELRTTTQKPNAHSSLEHSKLETGAYSKYDALRKAAASEHHALTKQTEAMVEAEMRRRVPDAARLSDDARRLTEERTHFDLLDDPKYADLVARLRGEKPGAVRELYDFVSAHADELRSHPRMKKMYESQLQATISNKDVRQVDRMAAQFELSVLQHGLEPKWVESQISSKEARLAKYDAELKNATSKPSLRAVANQVRREIALLKQGDTAKIIGASIPHYEGRGRVLPTANDVLEHSKLETGDSLDRVSGDARSVADTVAAAKKNPAYKALFKALGDIAKGKQKPETLQKNLQGVVDRLSKAFGVSTPEVRLFDRSTVIEHQGEQVSLSDNIGMLQRQRGLPSLMHIRGDLKTHEAVSTVLHEFGHHLQHELFDKLADLDPSRLAIVKDFKRWRSQLGSDATTRDVRSSRAPFFGTLADLRIGGDERMLRDMDPGEAAKYVTSFSEYFADMTARALTEHEGVQGIVGEFFGKVAHAMRLVYDLLTGNDRKLAEAPQSFKDFVSRTWRDAPEQPPEAAARARAAAANNLGGRMRRGDALAAAAEASGDIGATPPGGTPPPDGASPGGAGGAPSDVTLGMNSRDRGLIEKVITRRDVFEKILKEFPQLRDRLLNYSTQMETATNAAYALWAAGKLKLSGDGAGTGYAGAFRRFGEQVKNVFGLKSSRQLGERIFKELAAGTYDMKENVRVKQRRDYLNDLATRAKSAKDVEAAALKGRIALRRSINYALHIQDDVVRPLVDRVLRGLDERLRATNNPALRKFVSAINRMTGEIGGQEGYVNQIHRITNQRANQLSAMVDDAKLSKDDEALVMKHLMLGGDVPNRPELTALRNRIYGFTSQFERSHKQGGSFGHITGGFFPYRFDHVAARANEAEVHSIMSEIGGAGDKDKKLEQGARDYFAAHWAKQHASEFLQKPEARSSLKGRREAMTALNTAAKQYADGLSVEALRERMADILLRDPVAHFRASLQDDPFMGSRKPGGGPSLNPRAFGLFDKAGRHDLLERLQKFQSPGIVDTMLPYLHAMVKRQTFYDNFVKERSTPESKHLPAAQQVQEQYNILDDHLAAAKESGATDKELQLARDYMDAQLGLYGDPNGHPLIQKLFAAVDKQLGTKLGAEDSRTWEKISNAVTTYQNLRVLGLGILGNMIDPLGNWTRSSSLGTALTGYRKAASAAFKKSDASYLRAHAEALGVAERHALSEGLSWAFNATGTPGTMSYRINQALFKYNGMHMMTNFARIAALASAHKFLLEHAQLKGPHSQRYLDELGLKASDIKPDAQHPGYVDASSEKVQKALFQFVDESVVRPHAGHRPLWHADPGFKMMSQYRGFIFSFYDTIVKRMMHEAKHGNLGGVAPLVGYLGVTMAAELAREMVQYGPAGNPSRKDWGAADWVAYSMERSGAMGPRADFMNSAYPELAYSRVPIPYESLAGPTVSQVDDLVSMALGQHSTGSTVLQSLPGESIYHGWVHRGSGKSTHQSAGQIAANFADDFVLE